MSIAESIQVKHRSPQETPPIRKKKRDRAVVEPSPEPIGNGNIAYVIDDANFGRFEVQKSANAWLTDRTKVERLIEAFKFDATILEACFHSGITERQYKYFIEVHPDFCTIKTILKQCPILKARQAVVNALDNPHLGLAYLERKLKDEFSTKSQVAIGQAPPPIEIEEFPENLVNAFEEALVRFNRKPLYNGPLKDDTEDDPLPTPLSENCAHEAEEIDHE